MIAQQAIDNYSLMIKFPAIDETGALLYDSLSDMYDDFLLSRLTRWLALSE